MPIITPAWLVRIPRLSELVLVLCAAWLVSVWLLPDNQEAQPEYQAGQPQEKSSLDQQLLLKTGLFGDEAEKPKQQVAQKVIPQKMPTSRLSIKLMGTLVSSDMPAAILSVGGKAEQKVFFVGQTIQTGVKLHSVETRAIVVDVSGSKQRISLQDGGKARRGKVASGSFGKNSRAGKSSRTVRQVSRAMINQQTKDLSRLLTQARVTPHFVNGKSDGFVISSIAAGSLYEKIGVQNGDVIRKVNGAAITGSAQAMSMFESLKSASSVSLQIQRAGRIQDIQYNIR